jgi:hypothetical protein
MATPFVDGENGSWMNALLPGLGRRKAQGSAQRCGKGERPRLEGLLAPEPIH